VKDLKMGLYDTSFRHTPRSTVPGNPTEFIDWNRSNPTSESLVCFTNEQILSEERKLIPKSQRVALLYESRDTMSWLYRDVEKVISDFKYFFTHEKNYLEKFSNTRWIPGNGIWIGNDYGGGARGIQQKDRLLSFLTSNKQTTSLQKLRVLLAQELGASSQYNVDVYHRSSYAFDYISASQCLSRYNFSIIIENTRSPWYFTEKILNCFAVGTIPIYLGANEIDRFFNSDGIIDLLSRSQLLSEVLPALSQSYYMSKIEAVEDNFEKSLEFLSIEKVIFDTLNRELEISSY
jgi:hypothetical protein